MKTRHLQPTPEPLDILRLEHRLILTMLGVLERIGEEARRHPLHEWPADLERLMTFLRVFVDLCHHGKEEEVLFPVLAENGISEEDGPIGTALDEHVAFRAYLEGTADALAAFQARHPGARAALEANISGLVDLGRSNIAREERQLLTAAEQVLNRKERKMIGSAFTALEAEYLPRTMREDFEKLIRELPRRYRGGEGDLASTG